MPEAGAALAALLPGWGHGMGPALSAPGAPREPPAPAVPDVKLPWWSLLEGYTAQGTHLWGGCSGAGPLGAPPRQSSLGLDPGLCSKRRQVQLVYFHLNRPQA